uniref:LysR substrate-binding domain-containing protein n=1 Tax=Roseovarius indicus TaxID=540747 RepID=UPI003B5165A4
MRLSHLNGWRAVEAVHRLGGIAAAADDLGVTRAAVTAQVRGLEDRLGRVLFTRTPGGLRPTPDLVAVADRLTEAMTALARAQEALTFEPPGNRVAVSVTQTFAETWLPRHLPDLFPRLGQIDLNLNTTWDVVDLHGADLHFAIRYMGEITGDLAGIPLLPSGVVPVCTPDFAARYGLGAGPMDVNGVPLVNIDVPTTDPDWAGWTRWGQEMGAPVDISQETQPRYALTGSGVRLAHSGVGLVLGGLSEIFASLARGTLIMPFGQRSVFPGAYEHKLIWIDGQRFGPVQRAFRDWVVEKAREDRRVMAEVFGL